MTDRDAYNARIPTAPPLTISGADQAIDEGSEFDALSFLENFTQQHQQNSYAQDHAVENRNLTYGTHSQNVRTSLEERDTSEIPVFSSINQNEFPNDNDMMFPTGDPPPRYEDVLDLQNPYRETSVSRTCRGDMPPQYNEVGYIGRTNENYPNTNRGNTRALSSAEPGGVVLQDSAETAVCSRYIYDPVPGHPRHGMNRIESPTTTFCIAIWVTVFCCCPLGIFAIWQSSKAMLAAKSGNTRASRSSSSVAKLIIFVTIIFGLITYALLIFAGVNYFSQVS